jgi:GH43 family beta-xylosidase
MKSKGQKESKKHEVRLAKKIGGQRNAGSGAFWSRKGDVRSSDVLIEHKYTGKASFTVKAAVLEKIVKEAILESRMPVLGISLNENNYILLTEDDFLEMRQTLQEHKTCIKKTSDTTKAGDMRPSVEE